jgi:hypothetical protein
MYLQFAVPWSLLVYFLAFAMYVFDKYTFFLYCMVQYDLCGKYDMKCRSNKVRDIFIQNAHY